MTREMSRRRLLTGVCGIAAGSAATAAGGGTALAGSTAGRRAAATAARRSAGRTGRAPGVELWRAQVATATPFAVLDVAAGYGMVYACNVPAPPSGAGLACAFDAHTGARAWQRPAVQLQPGAGGPGAGVWGAGTPRGKRENRAE